MCTLQVSLARHAPLPRPESGPNPPPVDRRIGNSDSFRRLNMAPVFCPRPRWLKGYGLKAAFSMVSMHLDLSFHSCLYDINTRMLLQERAYEDVTPHRVRPAHTVTTAPRAQPVGVGVVSLHRACKKCP